VNEVVVPNVMARVFLAFLAVLLICCEKQLEPWEPFKNAIASDPAWSPDGLRVYYERDGRIWSTDTQGNSMCVTQDWAQVAHGPDVSPDGSWLLWESGASILKARLLRDGKMDTASVVCLTERGRNYNPDWSPEGTHITYDSDMEADTTTYYGMCFMDSGGGSKRRICGPAGYGRSPDWRPDGSSIAFAGFDSGIACILTMATDGTCRHPLVRDGNYHWRAVWSPDARMVAFDVQQPSGRVSICTVDSNGRSLTEVTTGVSPAWSPDGRRLAFVDQLRGGDYATLFVIDVATGQRRQLVWE
jgi:Tol biopolymer transport system component